MVRKMTSDGWLDLLLVNGHVYPLVAERVSRGTAVGDLDDDGR